MAHHEPDQLLGQIVDTRYLVLSKIASGGMATVYLARDQKLGREVALKVMHAHLAQGASGANFVSRFHREAQASASLAHPGLVAIFDQGTDGDISYLAMEYVAGTNLRTVLATQNTLPVARALDITDQVLSALATAHSKGLVHRDIKPENLLIDDEDRVKLADFGLARAVTEVTSTTTGTLFGTVAYLSPELITRGIGDTRSDLYAIGVMLFEMLSGRPPITGESPIHVAFQHANTDIVPLSSVIGTIDPSINDFVASLVARDPDKRPADAGQALKNLREVTAGLSPESLAFRAVPLPSNTDPDTDGILLRQAPGPVEPVRSPASAPDTDPANRAIPHQPSPQTSIDSHVTQALAIGSGTTTALPVHTLRERPPASAASASPSPSPSGTAGKKRNAKKDRGRSAQIEPTGSGTNPPTKKAKKGRGRLITVWVLLLTLLGAGTYGGFYWWNNIGPGAYTLVPHGILGVPLDSALAKFTDVELETKVTTAYDDVVDQDLVIKASPEPGERIRKGATVTLTQSLGIETHAVPEGIVGMTEAQGIEALSEAGFTSIEPQRTYATGTKPDVILQMSVEQGKTLPHNTNIILTVSDGPEPITIPSVVGQSQQDAEAALKKLEVKAVIDTSFSDTVAKGSVISQSPEGASAGHRGDSVSLTVSLGPDLVKVPNVTGKSTKKAQEQLAKADFKVDTKYYLEGFFGLVRFQEPAAGTMLPRGSTVTITIF